VSTVRVERVGPLVGLALRQRVLRPDRALADAVFPGDEEQGTAHFAAFDDDGVVVGVGRVRPDAVPWSPSITDGWRLRGMATEQDRRSLGVGAAVLAALICHVSASGGGLLWCSARLAAVPFYRRGGFVTQGEPWADPELGPHVQMQRVVTTPETARSGGRPEVGPEDDPPVLGPMPAPSGGVRSHTAPNGTSGGEVWRRERLRTSHLWGASA